METVLGNYMRTLDLGCGRAKTPGAIGLDRNRDSDADVLYDVDQVPYPFRENTFDRVICNGIIEHVDDVVRVMEELHRICRAGAVIAVTTPYFTSVDAFTDPTHRHYFSSRSFDYFTGEFPEYAFYSKARFRKQTVDIRFWSLPRLGHIRPQHWLGAKILADHLPMLYERFFAYLLPAQSIFYELVVVK